MCNKCKSNKDKNILIRVTQEEKDKFKLKAEELGFNKVSKLILSLIDDE